MEALYIPIESDLKRWVKEAVQEYFQNTIPERAGIKTSEDDLISRKDVAKLLQVSLLALTD